MAVRSQYQYQQVIGPVFVPAAAPFDPQNLEWLPRGQQPARTLLPNRLGDFVRPEFEALYKPEGLQWQAVDRYFGRPLPNGDIDWTIFQQPPIAPSYDPRNLEWMAVDRYYGRPLSRALPNHITGFPARGLFDDYCPPTGPAPPAPPAEPGRTRYLPLRRF